MANSKNETFAISLQLCVQWSEIICIVFNSIAHNVPLNQSIDKKVDSMLPRICSIESHSSENSLTLIGYLGEVFSVKLRLLKVRSVKH